MLLSHILEAMPDKPTVRLQNERPFEALGLLEGKTPSNICSFLADIKYAASVRDTVSMLMTTEEIAKQLPQAKCGFCLTDQPRQLFFHLHNYLSDSAGYKRSETPTVIGQNCVISPMASIAPHNVVIGEHVRMD